MLLIMMRQIIEFESNLELSLTDIDTVNLKNYILVFIIKSLVLFLKNCFNFSIDEKNNF